MAVSQTDLRPYSTAPVFVLAELDWMDTRWRNERHLSFINLDPNDVTAAGLFPIDASRPAKLISLQLYHSMLPKEGCWVESDYDSDSESEGGLVDFAVVAGLLQRLVSQSPSLKYLALSLREPVDLPLLPRLHILDVELVATKDFVMLSHLGKFEALEILFLGSRRAEYDEPLLEMPPMDLTGLQNLSRVVFRDLRPELLALREGCWQGHVWTLREDDTLPALWLFQPADIRADVLAWDIARGPLTELPAHFTVADRMSLVSIKVLADHLTLSTVPQASFNLDRCQLSGVNVAVRIPVGVHWKEVDIVAVDVVNLSFEHRFGFLAGVHKLRVSYKTCSDRDDMLHIGDDLMLQGKDFVLIKGHEGRNRLVAPAVLANAPLDMPIWGTCTCGCCYSCLTAMRYSLK